MRGSDAACQTIYEALARAGVSVLYDDTDERAGAKFTSMDLIGLPLQVVVGPKGLKSGEVEIKARRAGARETVSLEAAIARVVSQVQSELAVR